VRQLAELTLFACVAVLTISTVVFARTPDAEKGKAIFQQSCSVCHGPSGQGDGYRNLTPPPADLTSPTIQGKADEALLGSIREGHPNTAMGTWKMAFSEEEMRDVLAYIRILQEK